jgi:hypothetical protein
MILLVMVTAGSPYVSDMGPQFTGSIRELRRPEILKPHIKEIKPTKGEWAKIWKEAVVDHL